MNILIVEDDKEILAFLKDAFRKEGFAVDAIEDGALGAQKARMNEYDVVILDNRLPNKTGKDICTEIRSMNKSAAILMLSVLDQPMTKVDLLNSGADDYMTKPFVWSELLARVRALLRRPKHVESEVLTAGDLSLNINQHTIAIGSKEVYLTPKEFTFLAYLMRNRGRVVSRMSILEHVWGSDTDPFTNTVEAHLANIRRKLGGKHKKSLIHTIPGVGYKIS